MTTQRHLRFVYRQTAVMLAAILALAVMGALTLRWFFLVSLVGLFVLAELTAPVNVRPRWRRRLRLVGLLGLAAFGVVVLEEMFPGAFDSLTGAVPLW